MPKQVRITNQYANHWTNAEVGWRQDPCSCWAPHACLGGRKITLRTLVCASRIIHTRPALRMQSRTLSGVLQGLRATRHNHWGALCKTQGALGHAQPLGSALRDWGGPGACTTLGACAPRNALTNGISVRIVTLPRVVTQYSDYEKNT